ncbi:MAG: hypothetical protein ACRDGG_11775, partial [Anaerolineae bacterium]
PGLTAEAQRTRRNKQEKLGALRVAAVKNRQPNRTKLNGQSTRVRSWHGSQKIVPHIASAGQTHGTIAPIAYRLSQMAYRPLKFALLLHD